MVELVVGQKVPGGERIWFFLTMTAENLLSCVYLFRMEATGLHVCAQRSARTCPHTSSVYAQRKK